MLAGRLFRTALRSLFPLTLLLTLLRLTSRRPLPAGSLLWTSLLSRGIGLRLGSLWLRPPSALRLSTLDGRPVLAGRSWSLGRLRTLRASGRRSCLLTLLALTRGRGRLRMLYTLGFHGRLRSSG